MIDRYIKDCLKTIINIETGSSCIDWDKIDTLSFAAICYINENKIDIDNDLYHFLEDNDIRKKSKEYQRSQIEKIKIAIDQN